MHFSLSASLLALAATATTASAVSARHYKDLSYLGNWNVTLVRVMTDDSISETVTAKYTNSTNPKGITHDCEKFSMPDKEGQVSCNGPFTYDYDGQSEFAFPLILCCVVRARFALCKLDLVRADERMNSHLRERVCGGVGQVVFRSRSAHTGKIGRRCHFDGGSCHYSRFQQR